MTEINKLYLLYTELRREKFNKETGAASPGAGNCKRAEQNKKLIIIIIIFLK